MHGRRSPLTRRWAGLGPFAAATAFVFATTALPPAPRHPPTIAVAAVVTAALAAGITWAPFSRLPRWTEFVPAFGLFAVIALLRHAQGGTASGLTPAVIVPVFWIALQGSRTAMSAAVAATAALFIVPLLVFGGPEYALSDVRTAALWTVNTALVGYAVQRLVSTLHAQTGALARMGQLTRDLPIAADPRGHLCGMVQQLTGSDFVALFEPAGTRLTPTFTLGLASEPAPVHIDEPSSGTARAYRTRRSEFVADARNDTRVLPEQVAGTGARTLLFQPFVREDAVVGVVVIGYRRPRRRLSTTQLSLLSTLASEVAVALERDAHRRRLATETRTDALTGVANRRRLEEELPKEIERASRNAWPLCVAMVDFDHFKDYNDREGHQAGDRLLAAAAAAFGEALRLGDLLARYGGEEFAVVLPDCGLHDARLVIERLCTLMPEGRTCSAGLAAWTPDDSAADLLGRADRVLYEAKRQGRNRVVVDVPAAEPCP